MRERINSLIVVLVCLGSVFSCRGVFAFTPDESLFVQHLRDYTREKKDFQPALGEQMFEGKTTGLRDASPEVRARAAEIIADYGGAAQLEQLAQALSRERDELSRQMMEMALQRLQARQDNAFATRLWNQARKSGDLAAVLGETEFAGRQQTGLRDANPYIRRIAAEIILDAGSKEQLDRLLRAAQLERNASTRDSLYLSYVKAGLKFSDNPEYFLSGFLNDCQQAGSSGEGVPQEALEYALRQAGVSGMQGLKSQIAGLQAALQEEKMRKLARETEATLDTASQYSNGQPVGEDMYISPNLSIQQYAFNRLLAVDSAQTQQDANRMIVNLLAQKNRGAFILEQLMRERGILRSENENACLEFGGGQPDGWQVSAADEAKVVYPSAEAYSYQRALEIENYAQETRLSSNQVEFSGELPKSVEFGLSYKVLPFSQLEEDLVKGNEPASLVLRMKVTLQDGTNAQKEIRQDYFYAGGWESLADSFSAASPENPLRQVHLEAVITGRVRLVLDDIYARRAEKEFDHPAPLVYGIELSSNVVLIRDLKINGKKKAVVDPVKLEAQVEAPKESKLFYNWYSDLSGDLGGGLKKEARLAREGKHQITFIAKDEYGFTSEEYAQVEVVRPKPILLREKPKGQGKLFLRLGLGELEKRANELEIKAYLYANKKPIAASKVYPCIFKIDLRRLPKGKVEFQAKVYIEHVFLGLEQGTEKAATPYSSNLLILEFGTKLKK